MILKIILFLAVVIPLVIFLRAVFFRRPTRIGERFREAKKQANQAVSMFLIVIGCAVVLALGKLIWTWWTVP